MSNSVLGWFKVIGAGAIAAAGVITAPLTAGASLSVTIGVVAALTGLGAAGAAAGALYHDSPTQPVAK